jgi:5-formyltetrahydrofolate cyclo-ligase
VYFDFDTFVLDAAQAACIALPAAGLPVTLLRLGGRGWALVAPVSVVISVVAISVAAGSADVLTWIALLLVPLAAFDRNGGRVGYGKGHFDRSIAALSEMHPVLTIGLAYAAQEIARRDYADVVLVDIVEGLPQGKGLDLAEADH